jgi:hypothetical protein
METKNSEFLEHIQMINEASSIPVKKKIITVFDHKPFPNQQTFQRSAFFVPQATHLDALVLYTPTLEHFYTIDNTASAVDVTYSETITTGFNFGMTQEVAVGVEFEFDAIFVKGKVSVSVKLGFSQEWTKEYSEQITLSVPGGKMGFLYRGVMNAAVLRYDPIEGSYRYLATQTGKYSSDIIKTTDQIIL